MHGGADGQEGEELSKRWQACPCADGMGLGKVEGSLD